MTQKLKKCIKLNIKICVINNKLPKSALLKSCQIFFLIKFQKLKKKTKIIFSF